MDNEWPKEEEEEKELKICPHEDYAMTLISSFSQRIL
jgi:hypothetical protein